MMLGKIGSINFVKNMYIAEGYPLVGYLNPIKPFQMKTMWVKVRHILVVSKNKGFLKSLIFIFYPI